MFVDVIRPPECLNGNNDRETHEIMMKILDAVPGFLDDSRVLIGK